MKKLLFTILTSLFCSYLGAQPPAPDFTVVTSDDEQRTLYADYLDQGKTVVIKFFFTYCPPCNAMAPLMEPYYQDWGGGEGDVEFISLSIQANDPNTAVAGYKVQYGHSFPGAGADGGSIDAVAPYLSGTYGDFLGTPTFAVIAPDGSVFFDPRGPNFQATLDSIDVAIAATGAAKPVTASLAGTVRTPAGAGIAGVEISVAGVGALFTGATDQNGAFDFSAQLMPDRAYTLEAHKNTNQGNGVTTQDLIRIQKKVLGIDTLSNYQLLAADANSSGHISTQDLIQLLRLIIFSNYTLSNNESWIFLDAAYSLPSDDPFSPFLQGDTDFEFSTDTPLPFSLYGLKVGDVNDSADPQN